MSHTTSHVFFTFEEELRHIQENCGIRAPNVAGGAATFWKEVNGWLEGSENNGNPWAGVAIFPDPGQNLSFPYPREELLVATEAVRKNNSKCKIEDVDALASRFHIGADLLDRPVTVLSGGERMLVSLAKAYALRGISPALCLCSPYFWLDSDHAEFVETVVEAYATAGKSASLVLLEGEREPGTANASYSSNGIEAMPWSLDFLSPTVIFPASNFPRATPENRINYVSLEKCFKLLSPTLIVGGNGVGKTTLARLLAGVERPSSGDVRINVGGLRGVARLILQDAALHLFGESIRGHLRRVFRYDATRAKEADKLFHEIQDGIIAMLTGWGQNIEIGDMGEPASLLQCKIALLAERLCSDSPLVIIDEPGWCLSQPVARAFLSVACRVAHNRKIALAFISHQSKWWDGISKSTIKLLPQEGGGVELRSCGG